MVTTNTASHGSPSTYTRLRQECENLLAIAKKIENVALTKRAFTDDADFMKLMDEFMKKRQDVISVAP
jgi:hypothetical protein